MAGGGSIQKVGINSWKLTISGGFDGTGKRIRHTKTIHASSEQQAKKQLALFLAEIDRGTIANTNKLKLKAFAAKWFEEHCQKNLSPKTQQSYKNHLFNRIIPALGGIDIDKLKPLQIVQFINHLKEPGLRLDGKKGELSSQAIIYCYRVLSSMLTDAVQWQIIASNPCDRVKPPTGSTKSNATNAYNETQVSLLLRILESQPIAKHMMILLALTAGLRLGELCGLEWKDFDFEQSKVIISRASQSVAGIGTFTKAPKNASSNRTVTLPTGLLPLLKELKAWQNEERLCLGNKWHESDRLFTQWNGAPIHVETPSKWFRKFLTNYNDSIEKDDKLSKKEKEVKKLPIIRFHDLRHTSGSLLIAQGVPLKNISTRLGHADIRTTANIYGHALQSVDKQIADTMNTIIFQKDNTSPKKGQA
jgi:integrase